MISKKTLGMVCKVLNSKLGVGTDYSSVNRIKKNGSSQKNSKKGFTLVELIVVLVVISILAGLAIPISMGFIDKAHEKQYIIDAKAALTATQGIFSDAYTDGMTSLPKTLRLKAKDIAEAGDDTAFTVWTAKHFSFADGTYKSSPCYTIIEAIYTTGDGHYVYYDGSEWTVYDEDDEDIQSVVSRADSSDESISKTNIVYVWPCDDSLYAKDSANGINKLNPEDYVDIATNDYKDDSEEGGIPEEVETNVSNDFVIDVYLVVPGKNQGLGFNPIADDNRIHLEYSADSLSFKTAVGDTAITSAENQLYSLDFDDKYDGTSLLWHLGSSTSADTYSSITGDSDGLVNYLKNLASALSSAESNSEDAGKSVSFYASIDPNRIPIDIYFMPYTTKQKVSVSDAETVQKEDGRTGGKVSVLYNEVSETVEGFPTQIDVSPNENEESLKVLSEEQREDVVRFNDEWIFKNDSGSSSSYEKVDTSLKDWTENWAKTQVEASKLNKDSEASVTFAAPADICKTAFLSVVNETESSESTGNTTSSPKMTLNDTDSVEVTFSEYEYDHKRYELRGENDETRVEVNDDYSIFKNTELLDKVGGMADGSVEVKLVSPNKMKLWRIFDCDEDAEKNVDGNGNPIELDKTREKDCTKEILDSLYAADYTNYWELAEVDASELTTRLLRVADINNGVDDHADDANAKDSPVRALFVSVAGGRETLINSINYIDYTKESLEDNNYAEKTSQVCISTTKPDDIASADFLQLVINDQSAPSTGDNLDPDYPGYTIAYSVGDSTDGYDIYVFTQDNTNIKAEGSIRHIHNKFSKMTTNTFLSSLDTTDVTSTFDMLNACNALETIDLSNFRADNLYVARGMFSGCKKLESITLGFGEAPVLTTVRGMFYDCNSLTSLNMDNFNTNHVSIFQNYFYGCNVLTGIGTNGGYAINIQNGSNFEYMFAKCKVLENARFTTKGEPSQVTSFPVNMYSECNKLKNITLDNANFAQMSGLQGIYKNDSKLEHAYFINGSKCGDGTSLGGLFADCSQIKNASFDATSTKNVVDMSSMFSGCTGLRNAAGSAPIVDGMDVTSAKNMSLMFNGCTGLISAETGVSTITAENLSGMFKDCSSMTAAEVHIDKATNISNLFENCTSLATATITGTSNALSAGCPIANSADSMKDTFKGAGVGTEEKREVNIVIKNIYFKNFTSAESVNSGTGYERLLASSISNAKAVTFEDVNFTGVKSMASVFKNFTALKNVYFKNSSYSGVTNMSSMFQGCTALNIANLIKSDSNMDGLDTQHVSNMSYMFASCTSPTNESTGDIRIDNATNIAGMFNNCNTLKDIVLCGDSISTEGKLNNTKANYTDTFKGAGVPGNDDNTLSITLKNISFPNMNFRGKNYSSLSRGDKTSFNTANGAYYFFESARTSASSITFQNVSLPNTYGLDYVFGGDNGSTGNAPNPNLGFKYLESITFDNFKAPHLGRAKGFFMNSARLKKVSFAGTYGGFDAPGLWNFSYWFRGCTSLETIEFGKMGQPGYISTKGESTEFWVDFNSMFAYCENLKNVDLTGFETSNCKNMRYMFYDCLNIGRGKNQEYGVLDLSTFDTHNVKNQKERDGANDTDQANRRMEYMFGTSSGKTSNIKTIYATENFVVDSTASGSPIFGDGLTNLVGGNSSNPTTMANAANRGKKNYSYYAWIDGKPRSEGGDTQGYFTEKPLYDTFAKTTGMSNDWPLNTGNNLGLIKTEEYNKDKKQAKASIIGFSRFNDPSIKTKDDLLKYLNDNNYVYKDATDTNYSDLNDGNTYSTYFWVVNSGQGNYIYWWSEADKVIFQAGNYSKVEETGQILFSGWTNATSIDMTGLVIDGVETLEGMYKGDTNLQSVTGLSITSSVKTFNNMFDGCSSLTSVEFLDIDTSGAKSTRKMFYNCSNLTTIDLSSFSTNNLENTTNMFEGCTSLETIYVSSDDNFNCTSVKDSGAMFKNCKKLVGGLGTTYSSQNGNYAHIDGGTSNPGYFTVIE